MRSGNVPPAAGVACVAIPSRLPRAPVAEQEFVLDFLLDEVHQRVLTKFPRAGLSSMTCRDAAIHVAIVATGRCTSEKLKSDWGLAVPSTA